MAKEDLTDLFNLTDQVYKSKIYELSNRLWALKNNSLLGGVIQSSIDPALNQLNLYITDIEKIKKEETKTFKEKFKSIREAESKIRREESILTLLEDVTNTFVSNMGLATALSTLFEYLYHRIINEFLFSIDVTGLENNLNKGVIPAELNRAFKNKGFSLSENATIKKKKDGKWEIATEENIYVIEKEDGKINTYTNEKMPFLITSGGGALKTFPYLKDKERIVVGTIGMPLYSVSHIDEWVLAGHELGHILANKIFEIPLKYNTNKKTENYKMELLCDKIALQVFGPVFLEALAIKLTGAESPTALATSLFGNPKHPPESWRIWMCNYQMRSFNFREAKPFKDSIESVINDIYPRPIDKSFDSINDALNTDEYNLNKVRPMNDLKGCYRNASKLSSKWLGGDYDADVESYTPDQIVIAGYLASRENPQKHWLYTQRVINSLIRIKKD